MADAWDEIFGIEPPPRIEPSIVNITPSADDPRTAGAVRGALEKSRENIINGKHLGGRNTMVNTEGFNLGQIVMNGLLTREQVTDHLFSAAEASGLVAEDGARNVRASIRSGLRAGMAAGPRTNLPQMGAPDVEIVDSFDGPDPAFLDANDQPRTDTGGTGITGKEPGPGARSLGLESFAGLNNRIPDWVWEYGGYGRMQLGVLSIFGGPAGSGKSTAARWFAAGFSRGRIPGYWEGEPVNVAYVAVEEDLDAMVRPSLEVAGADMNRIFYTVVKQGDVETLLRSKSDEVALTEQLLARDCRVLILDPIMGTLGSDVEINRNNEVRDHLNPYVNIAKAINGSVIGIAHYRKNGGINGVQAITGSSAFGEVARCVFGFMKYETDDGEESRVMSQSKNSAGREDLALEYALDLLPISDDEGREAEMTKFHIIGDSDVRVEDIMADGGAKVQTRSGDAEDWLQQYLSMNGPTPSKKVKADARNDIEASERTLVRAMQKLHVEVRKVSDPGRPFMTVWALPASLDGDDADRTTSEGDRYWE